ncbi:hypothetical protein XENTR_v10010836 [Xenopus tropicalis]|nr:hypothetical protein XENTR_v10010836 [Xenopus tropicalis]
MWQAESRTNLFLTGPVSQYLLQAQWSFLWTKTWWCYEFACVSSCSDVANITKNVREPVRGLSAKLANIRELCEPHRLQWEGEL